LEFIKKLDFFIILSFTLLFLYDYFPNIPLAGVIPENILIALIFGLYLFSLFFKRYRDTDNIKILKWQIYSTLYILFLMGLFTVLGGKSASGISFDNGFLWVFLIISIFDMKSQWKKVKLSKLPAIT
jgi:hypothetical protein